MDFKPGTSIFIAAFLSRSQFTKELCRVGCRSDRFVLVNSTGQLRFGLKHNCHVGVVRIFFEEDLVPETCDGRRRSIGRGVCLRESVGVQRRSNRIVCQRRNHNRETGLSNNLHRRSDSIVDIERSFVRRAVTITVRVTDFEAGIGSHLDDQAGGCVTDQLEATKEVLCVVVANLAVLDDVNDVRIIPDRRSLEVARPDFHPKQCIARTTINIHPIQSNQRPLVSIEFRVCIRWLSAGSCINNANLFHRVGVDTDDRALII